MKKYNEDKRLNKKSSENKEINIKEKENSNVDSLENNEMLDNLIKISGNEDVYQELKTETNKIKQLLSQSKEKLSNIDLYEKQKSDIDIYQWNNLFNQSIPITSYVTSSKIIKSQINKKEEIKNDNEAKENSKNLKHPVALVNLTDEEIKKYLPPTPVNIPPSQVIRFQQLPFRGNSQDAFYFSNSFNDYYKMDFKDFLKIMPILKAKKRCNSAKLQTQMKKARRRNNEEEHKREICNNEMQDKLNNLYIEKQYLSLSINSNNIQPLMSSIHSQIYPGEGDELTKHTKLYTKTNKPLGSERDIDSIDFTVNQRNYHRNVLNNIKKTKRRSKSVIKSLHLSRYDINDPDVAIFKKIEILEKMINAQQCNNGNQLLKEEKEEEKSIINCEGEIKEIVNIDNKIINNKGEKKLIKNEENRNNVRKINISRQRAMSATKKNKKYEEILNINNRQNKKFPRALSAHSMRPIEKQNEYFIHNVYLSSKNKLVNMNSYVRGKRNKLNDFFDDNKRGNSSSQISTYDGINNSIYEKKNIPSHGFPVKNNHEIPNKMYLKINNILKGKQYEKDQKKLEEFSKLIQLDDAFLYEDILKNNSKTNINGIKYLNRNKLFNRPLSSNLSKNIEKSKKGKKSSRIDLNNIQSPKTYRYSKNNFRVSSKKSSNENSKIEFTTSLPNNKQEFYMNSKNDKVTLIYFNDIIQMKPQNINDMKPIIKNDGIIVASNYFNRGKPQIINHQKRYRLNKNLKKVLSLRNLGETPKKEDNTIIQEEHLGMNKKQNNLDNSSDNKVKRRRIFSAKV